MLPKRQRNFGNMFWSPVQTANPVDKEAAKAPQSFAALLRR
jgi:hypothetical protein